MTANKGLGNDTRAHAHDRELPDGSRITLSDYYLYPNPFVSPMVFLARRNPVFLQRIITI